MYKNYKIVANTAVGRRRYLKYLLPQVLASDIVDRYDLWVNTLDRTDIAFFKAMAAKFPKLNLIWHPTGEINGIYSMAGFYPLCQEENTIYIKLDDDVVWFDPNFFEEICRFRVENPEYFLVSPLVINNGICNYILQNRGLLHTSETDILTCQGYDMSFYNGNLAEEIQRWFIRRFLEPGRYADLYCGSNRIAMQRWAINAVAWFGEEFRKFGGRLEGDDEEFLTVSYPVSRDMLCCFDCDTIVAHFSFSAQRAHLDSTDLLSHYERIIRRDASPRLLGILDETCAILADIDSRAAEINKGPLPDGYRPAPPPGREQIKKRRVFNIVGTLLRIPRAHRETFVRMLYKVVRPNRGYIRE